jgi:hypothetical protein
MLRVHHGHAHNMGGAVCGGRGDLGLTPNNLYQIGPWASGGTWARGQVVSFGRNLRAGGADTFINLSDSAILAADRGSGTLETKKALTRRAIFSQLHKHREILCKYKVIRIGLFGSY